MKETILKIEGMHCEGCTKRVKNALQNVDGVNEVEVSLDEKCAVVKYSDDIDKDLLKEKIDDIGFEVIDME